MKKIKHMRIKRSNFISDVRYDPEKQTLDIEMYGSRRYRYYGVTVQRFTAFDQAKSKGSYYSRNIRGQYKMRRLLNAKKLSNATNS